MSARVSRPRAGLRRRGAGLLLRGVIPLLLATGLAGGLAPAARAGSPLPRTADVDSLLTWAREAGRAGRHRDAALAYERAGQLDPYRHGDIQSSLAYQLTWAGDLNRALHEFRRALALHPDDYELRMGELLVTNWMGDHLIAARGYAEMVRAHPDRVEPRVGQAAAQNWAGRRDRALASVREALALDPAHGDATTMQAGLRRGLRPVGGVFADWSEDSDDYQVNSLWVEAAVSPHPQLRLVPFANRLGIRRPASPDIDETWVGMSAAWRPATRLGLWTRVTALADPAEGADEHPVTGAVTLEWTFTDRLQAGVFGDRFAAVSTRAFPRKITGESGGVFVQMRPDWLSRVRVSADGARYDEIVTGTDRWPVNHRWNLSVTASRQVWAPARLRVGVLGRYLDFTRDLDNGVWTPDRFGAGAATVEWDWGARDLWSANGAAELGAAREAGASTSAYLAYRVGVFRALGPYLVDLTFGHSEGNVETGTGYDRSYAHLGLRRRF